MTETPERRVARLERRLAEAKVTALQKELDEARAGGVPESDPPSLTKGPVHLSGPPAGPDAGPVLPSTWLPDSENPWTVIKGQSRQAAGDLAPAPRAVPAAFKLIFIPFSFWTLFTLFMVSVTPIALWMAVPLATAVGGALTFAVIVGQTLRRTHLRNTLLKWGEVATVTNSDLISRGTYYSGTTYQNVRLAQAHGWRIERKWYSGPASKTKIDYRIGSGIGTLTLRGLPYDDGVILADPRHPERALCVSAYPYALDRDASGNWVGNVPKRVLFLALLMSLILVGWTAAMIYLGVQAS